MTEQNSELIADRYQLVERIGQGGMGRVWRGLDQQLFGREVAIKEILFPPGMDEDDRAMLLRRFTGEARAAVTLSHPGIITIHDVAEHHGAPVIVMEFIRGQSLAAAIRREGRLPVRRVAEIGAAMLDALAEAHGARIVHRDIKPDNVLLTKDRVVLTDFGIAHLADATTKLSHSGIVIGTPQYMPPEQLEGKRPTPANDLWALGATLYHAVEGQPPFEAEGLHALAVAVFTRPYRPPVHAGPLAPVLEALLTKDPEQRVGATEAAGMLASVLRSFPAQEDPAATREPGPEPERDPAPEPAPDTATRQAPPLTPPKPRTPPTPHKPTVLDSRAAPVDPRRPAPDRPTGPPPEPVPVPPTEDLVSLGTTAKVERDEPASVKARALTRRSVVLGATLATLAAGSVLTWTLSGEDETPRGGGAAGSGATASAVTVVIGVDAPLSGGLSAMGLGIRNSADLAVRTANEKGYVPGVKFEIKALDDAADPAKGALNAARFVSDAKVLGVVGPLNSGTARTLVAPLAQADLVNVSPGNTDPALTLGPDWAAGTKSRPYDTYFRTVGTDVDQGPFAARYLHAEAGKRKVYVIDDKSVYGSGLTSGFRAEFEKLGGTVVGTEQVDPAQREFSGLAAKVRASGADSVYFGGYYDSAGPLSKQLKQAGVGIPLMGGDGIFDQQFLTSGPKADGDLAVNIGVPAEHEAGGADFLAGYRKAGYSEAAGWYGPYAYDATWSLIEAVKSLVTANGGTLPRDARAKMPPAVSRLSFDGVTGRVAFDGYGDTRNRRLTVYSVTDGQWTAETSGPVTP
ncbi:bifunctional serine/threonine-protein kinase/ABC transporter substrate-binding protein [Streptomyces sp. NBC_00638]|uniref:bifunctional serine/threonine-protein kinase/ABC transporter substrate-binding protein n=1 Tax=Streptomyces sp. NBC_00638 TaxID=2975794 RepID=UPI002257377C|nr:bifunctional serine/threonine-protein kinase/ABC transporter substrate-binding protein [Streptomyces sp. NBC_00638]MCX5008934.1 bifunctional serine/threonine-protein kinase/ABC transporter substrate-binding protein [Streptomyces sp. NBC_00638]